MMHSKVGSKKCQQLELESDLMEGLHAEIDEAMQSLKKALLKETRIGMHETAKPSQRKE